MNIDGDARHSVTNVLNEYMGLRIVKARGNLGRASAWRCLSPDSDSPVSAYPGKRCVCRRAGSSALPRMLAPWELQTGIGQGG